MNKLSYQRAALAAFVAFSALPASSQSNATITVDASVVHNRITRYMTGSCIEDVNHEIYGGLYAQRIFGESFEEPPVSLTPVAGWSAYGGQWQLNNGELHVVPDSGAKLIYPTFQVDNGVVSGDINLADSAGTNGALLVRVSDPHVGADNWNGYEIAISASGQNLTLHRHHNNWKLLKSVPARIAPGSWVHVRAELDGKTIRISLDGAAVPSLEFTDEEDPLLTGVVGVRTWQSDVRFKNIQAAPAGKAEQNLPLNPAGNSGMEVSGMWDRVQTGAAHGAWSWDSVKPYNTDHSQRLAFTGGSGTIGIANRGLNRWGINVRPGQLFAGRVYLRGNGFKGTVFVALQSKDGSKTYAVSALKGVGAGWKPFDFKLKSSISDHEARFALWIESPGEIWADQTSLMLTGADLYKGLPVRADIVNMLKKQGIHFLRYGGSMVNAPTYKWKQMLGSRDKRPQVNGLWYPQSTNGFGIEEFVQVCRAAGIEPAFAINIDETPEDIADMVEYLNGPETSIWGKVRAQNGHIQPYNVRYIEIGNEEAIDNNQEWYRRYLARFEALEPAIHAKDSSIQLVIAAWWRADSALCRQIAEQLNGKAALWDVHVGGDGLRDGEDVDKQMTTMKARLQEWCPGTTMKAAIFEENGGRHDLQRALGHAHIVNTTERLGDFIQMDCPANCLQPWLQNDNGWDQGQVFFTAGQVWGMPPYYAQKMIADSYQPICVNAQATSEARDLDVTATRDEGGKTLVIKVVNLGAQAHAADISIKGVGSTGSTAHIETLSGKLTDRNLPETPDKIKTVIGDKPWGGLKCSYTFPAHSFTVIRIPCSGMAVVH